ncbi:hypothetical protein F5Y04DRAFT_252182 [Hypomontagnella monticulosa]|nr:hypothetical protein F5Y04DRAFT_252182 [Hypomontagnella monticulosa]
MAKVQRSNYLPYLQQHLDAQGEEDGMAIETVCGICQERTLDISKSARKYTSSDDTAEEHPRRNRHLPKYIRHGLERTVVLACGHVFGDRCIGNLLAQGTDVTCPSCGFRMAYRGCGHAISPALIPVAGVKPIRDEFPLTIGEGGDEPRNCLECRWKLIRSNMRYTLSDECVICRQKDMARLPQDLAGHRVHRNQHVNLGIKNAFYDIVMLVWPEFLTRETESSASKSATEQDRREVHASLLNALVLSELDETMWYRTKAGKGWNLTKEQLRKHAQGTATIEQTLLGWLLDSTRESRRTW